MYNHSHIVTFGAEMADLDGSSTLLVHEIAKILLKGRKWADPTTASHAFIMTNGWIVYQAPFTATTPPKQAMTSKIAPMSGRVRCAHLPRALRSGVAMTQSLQGGQWARDGKSGGAPQY
jgi:hypothetical protein